MIPITTIGGYLGAGKTTLINHLLRHSGGQRLAVLVNEFGALPIDEDLIEAQDDQLISIAGGCVCCAFGDDLMAGVTSLSQLTPPPDHVLLEASGVAIPGAIAASLSLVQGIRLGGVVVLADAETIGQAAQDAYIGDTILRQLSDADLLVLTKTDLVPDPGPVTAWLKQQSPARIIPALRGAVPLEVIAGPQLNAPRTADHADHDYETTVFAPEDSLDAPALAQALAEGPYGVIRAKGFLRGEAGMCLVQVVGQRYEVAQADETANPGLVCIGFKGQLKPDALNALMTDKLRLTS